MWGAAPHTDVQVCETTGAGFAIPGRTYQERRDVLLYRLQALIQALSRITSAEQMPDTPGMYFVVECVERYIVDL